MFNYQWKNRIILLENQMRKLLSEDACSKGQHDWEMTQLSSYKPPFIRCKHCYAIPLPESKDEK